MDYRNRVKLVHAIHPLLRGIARLSRTLLLGLIGIPYFLFTLLLSIFSSQDSVFFVVSMRRC